MKEHEFILTLFLASTAFVAVLFYYIYRTSKGNNESSHGMKDALKKRILLFFALTGMFIVVLSVTIPKSPYFLFSDKKPSKIVYVAAQQYYFMMSYQAIDKKNPSGGEEIDLPLNEPVEFRVTSFDVNHGFAIYKNAELITQTQAMPGYVNRLRWKFIEPGTYEILCLEYCGAGHQVMRSSFTVK